MQISQHKLDFGRVSFGIAYNEQGFVSVAEIELPQFKPQTQPNSSKQLKLRTSSRNSTKPRVSGSTVK